MRDGERFDDDPPAGETRAQIGGGDGRDRRGRRHPGDHIEAGCSRWIGCLPMPKLLVVIASTRPGRVGLPVGEWFYERALAHGGFDPELVDLAVLDLPLLDEPNHPRMQKYTKEHTLAWSATVAAADAVVLVTAEYNYGYPAALKNALDYLHHEWRHKAVGFVSYGGVAAGTRAVQQLKQVVGALMMFPAQSAVNIPFVNQFISDEQVAPNDEMQQAAAALLNELLTLDGALAALRA
jgi:NAD(P)H-dependent FMN reductase